MKDKSEEILRVFNENAGLMKKIASKYSKYVSYDDIYTCQLEGINKALENYDPKRGKFLTYVSRCICWCIAGLIRTEIAFHSKAKKHTIRREYYYEDKTLTDFFIDAEDDDMKDIVEKKIVGRMSFKEIGKDTKSNRETVRKKFNKFAAKFHEKSV